MKTLRILDRALVAGVLLAAAAPVASAQSGGGGHAPRRNIVQTAVAAGSFTTLVALVKAANLVGTLSGQGPFTVFAPTDAAFAKVPKATRDGLAADEDALRGVLTFHVVPGRITAADILKAGGAMPKTVNGQQLDVQVRDGKVYVNGAPVVTPDVGASNGVIHVIDAVLLPSAEK